MYSAVLLRIMIEVSEREYTEKNSMVIEIDVLLFDHLLGTHRLFVAKLFGTIFDQNHSVIS